MDIDLKSEKRKYLKRAKHFLKKPEKPIRKLQASVGPFVHHARAEVGIAGSSISDPTAAAPTSSSPLIQRVTPTMRSDSGSSPELLSSKFTSCTERAGECGAVEMAENSENEQEAPPLSPKYGHMSVPNYSDNYNHLFSSTPVARVRDYTGLSHFITERSPPLQSPMSNHSELESRLKIQTDVNRELKRLLVASMGSDLQHRLNQIAEEKATISRDLDASLQQLVENHEEIDRVSIECDVWRSKFLASQLMIDELAVRKAEVSRQLQESQRALHYMLKERTELSNLLVQCNRNFNEFGTYFEANITSKNDGMGGWLADQDNTVLEVAMAIASKARFLCEWAGLVEDGLAAGSGTKVFGMGKSTPGERLAKQVLKNGHQSYTVQGERTLPSPLNLKDELSQQRHSSSLSHARSTIQQYLLGSQTQNILFQCNRCKGRVYEI